MAELYYFTHSSAFQGMEIMKMAEDIIHQEFGESPELVMSLLYRQQTFGARIFALGDISRCLLDRGRRCV
jgi:S-adenosylmethionine:tRNA-ribosyltransferase-isomerase (queuine synthetase)